jgi:microcystin-dependent protein
MADTYLGDVRAMSFAFAPRGWAPCKGQLLPVAGNRALYSLLGNSFGGDSANFALPALHGVPTKNGPALNYCICVNGTYPTQ